VPPNGPRLPLEELFGRGGVTDAAVLVTISPSVPGADWSTGAPVTVRGQRGRLAPAKEFSSTTSTLGWGEGATITASFHGLTTSEAVVFVDSLQWRSVDHQAGFAPPVGRSFIMLGESRASSGQAVSSGDFHYRNQPGTLAPGVGLQLEVRTTAASDDGGTSHAYLEAWFHGEQDTNGRIESYDPDFHTLMAAWRDGQAAWVDAYGTPVARAQEERVVDGLQVLAASDLQALRSAMYARTTAAIPVLATAALPSATIEVRGPAGTPLVLCLLVPGAERSCGAVGPVLASTVGISALFNGTWYVAAAGPIAPTIRPPFGRSALPAESGTAGQWSVVLAKLELSVALVDIWVGNQGVGRSRPSN